MTLFLILASLLGASDEPYLAWESTAVKPSATRRAEKPAGRRLGAAEIETLVAATPPIPFRDVSLAYQLSDGTVWAGSPRGLMRRGPCDARWRLFHSRTWLLD